MNYPTRTELLAELKASISESTERDANIPFSLEWSVAQVMSVVIAAFYRMLPAVESVPFPADCDNETLLKHASMLAIERNEPTKAQGTITINGTVGVTVPSGTVWVSQDGKQYQTTEDGTLEAGDLFGTVTVTAECLEYGTGGNLESGATFTIHEPMTDVLSAASAASDFVGSDADTIEQLRADVETAYRKRPQGGAVADYEQWARQASGLVGIVSVVPFGNGAGSVNVYVLQEDGTFISEGNRDAIADYIDADNRRPATHRVYVLDADRVAVDLSIELTVASGFVADTVKAEIQERLTAAFVLAFQQRNALAGYTVVNDAIRAAIYDPTRGVLKTVLHDVNGDGNDADIELTCGQLAEVGDITWV